MSAVHYIHKGRVSPYPCGAGDGAGSTAPLHVTCTECLDLLGSATQPILHTPPIMNDNDDGLFLFHDRRLGAGYTMELAPQSTGNIEITLEDASGEGYVFTLSHLDRADMLRALLHEFHYSPERGGPNDD